MSMTTNKQTLREKAEKAKELGNISQYKTAIVVRLEFNEAANPATVLALLDELEASHKSNEFLKGQLSELANFNPDWDKLEASYESWREIAAELLVAKDRISELEAAERRNAELVHFQQSRQRALTLLNDASTENLWETIGRLKTVISGDYRSDAEIHAATDKGE